MTYVLDTNIVSYALKKRFIIAEIINKKLLEPGNSIIIPPVTLYEILRGLYEDHAVRRLNLFNVICQNLGASDLDKEDWIQAAELYVHSREMGRPMEDADILQAAFCIRRGYTLVTHNVKHFSHLKSLLLEDWVTEQPGAS
jgi:tRNA(fMet)-specific endonuclease VapC